MELARDLLDRLGEDGSALSEADIDAEFLFRFEPVWCEWVSRIRGMMREMMEQEGDGPLSPEDGAAMLLHLERNAGVSVGLESERGLTIETPKGGYRPLDQKLREASEQVFFRAKLERSWPHIWGEANLTQRILYELGHLARVYNLVPQKREESRYSPDETKQLFGSVVSWVIWGETVPSFRWPMTRLVENRTGEGVKRKIRPYQWVTGRWQERENGSRAWMEDDPNGTRRMSKEVRVRTWAVYCLTRRGGGRRIETPSRRRIGQSAIELWNDTFRDVWKKWSGREAELEAKNFREERDRLFEGGVKKG